MSDELKQKKREWARMKRIASELAGEIHDIVEDTLWEDYDRLGDLSQRLAAACDEARQFQKANDL